MSSGLRLFVVFSLLLGTAIAADEPSVDQVVGWLEEVPKEGHAMAENQPKGLEGFRKLDTAKKKDALLRLIRRVSAGAGAEKKDGQVLHAAAVSLSQLLASAEEAAVLSVIAPDAKKALSESKEAKVREYVAWLIGLLGDPSLVPALLHEAARGDDGRARKMARAAVGEALRKTPFADFANACATVRSDEELFVRLLEAEGDFEARVRAVVPYLVELMNDANQDYAERCHAARLLGLSHIDIAGKALLDRMLNPVKADPPNAKHEDPGYDLRATAATALRLQKRSNDLVQAPAVRKQMRRTIEQGGFDANPALRSAFLHLLGATGDGTEVEFLVGVLRDDTNAVRDFDDTIRTGAFLGLKEMARKPLLAEAIGDAMLPLIEHDDPHVQAWAIDCLETMRDHLPRGRSQDAVDTAIKKRLRSLARDIDRCKVLCRVIDQRKKWSARQSRRNPYNVGAEHPPESLWLASMALESLALTYSLPICGGDLIAEIANLRRDVLAEDGDVARWAKINVAEAVGKDGTPKNSPAIYAKAFLVHLYAELLASTPKDKGEERKTLEKKIAQSQVDLERTLGRADKSGEGHPFPASVNQTHAFAIALIAAKNVPEPAQKLLDALAKLPAAGIPYYPTHTVAEDARGAAGRSVTFQAAAFRKARNAGEKKTARKRKLEALKAWTKYVWVYRSHATREGAHGALGYETPKNNIAPYYYWTNLAHVGETIRAFRDEKDLAGDELAIVEEAETETVAALSASLNSDGQFKSPAVGTFPQGQSWSNSFGAMALASLATGCKRTPKPARLFQVP